MISTLLRVSWLNLKRDYVALGLTFVLPIVFFSIFAMIFGGMGGGGGGNPVGDMSIIVVDEDNTTVSSKLVEAIDGQSALTVVIAPEATSETPDPEPYTRETARLAVRRGRHPAALVIPEGFGAGFGDLSGGGRPVDLIHDPSNPLARHTITGLLQASAMMAAPDVLMEKGLEQLEIHGEALTPAQRSAVDDFQKVLRGDATWEDLDDDTAEPDDAEPAEETGRTTTGTRDETADEAEAEADDDVGAVEFTGLVEVNAISARADESAEPTDRKQDSIIPYYAAGIGVMFLLFSMAGAAGSLLEEEESGTLERLLTSNVGMGTLLAGNWLFFAIVGFLQLTVMFVWGALVYDLELFTATHLAGFVAMTVVTAAAAAGFGLILATLCRSRAQLSGISTVVILIMSALGGSMVPRFVMPEFMKTTSLFTFNGWALDGYLNVFWYDDPGAGVVQTLRSIAPQLAVLAGLTVVFLLVARVVARRWENG